MKPSMELSKKLPSKSANGEHEHDTAEELCAEAHGVVNTIVYKKLSLLGLLKGAFGLQVLHQLFKSNGSAGIWSLNQGKKRVTKLFRTC